MALNYVQLIEKVMGEYDSIWSAITSKNTSLLTQVVPTEDYAEHIERLTFIKNLPTDTNAPNSVEGLFSIGTTPTIATLNIATNGLTREGTTFKLKGNYDKSYYIDSSVSSVATLGSDYVKDISFSGNLATFANATTGQTFSETDAAYTLTANNYLIGSVSVSKGTVTTVENIVKDDSGKVTAEAIEFNNDLESTVSLDTAKTNVDISEEDKDGTGYKIVVKGDAILKNVNISASTKTTVEAGYVKDNSFVTTVQKEIDDKTVHAEDLELYLPQGGVEIHSVDAEDGSSATATITPDLAEVEAGSSDPFITLNAAVKGALNLKAVYTEGYVRGTQDNEGVDIDATNITIDGGEFKLKKSTVATATTLSKPVISMVEGYDASILSSSTTDENVFPVTFKTTAIENIQNTTVTSGFVTSGDLAKSKLNIPAADNVTINIKKAVGVKATAAVTSYSVESGNEYLDSASDIAITVKPVLSNTIGLVDGGRYGYVSADTDITASATPLEKTIKIKKGTVGLNTPTLNLSSHEATSGDDKPAYGEVVVSKITDVFTVSKPTNRDYLKLNTTASFSSFAPGYISEVTGDETVSSVDYYLPKAEFAWYTDDETKEEYLKVISGGYVPSGLIKDITTVEENNALVTLSLTNSNVSLKTTLGEGEKTTDYHLLQIGANVNAGYISDSTIAENLVNTEYYLKKAKLAATAALTFDEPSEVERVLNEDKSFKGYELTIKATADASYGANTSEGYITAAEISASASDSEEDTKTISINRAVFDETTHTTTIASEGSSGLLGGTTGYSSAYYVTPSVSACSVAFTVSQSGYISNDDKDILKFEGNGITHTTTANPYYIKASSADGFSLTNLNISKLGYTGLSTTSNKITADAASNVYKITLSGKIDAKIAISDAGQGYVGSTEVSAIAAKAQELDFTKDITIAKGSTSVTVSGATSISTAEGSVLELFDNAADENDAKAKFVEISAGATATSTTTITEGYVKNVAADKGDVTEVGLTGAKKYIKLFETTDKTYSDTDTYNHTVGHTAAVDLATITTSPSITISTENKYLSKDTVVTVGEHTVGSSVAAKLLALEERMSGKKVAVN